MVAELFITRITKLSQLVVESVDVIHLTSALACDLVDNCIHKLLQTCHFYKILRISADWIA